MSQPSCPICGAPSGVCFYKSAIPIAECRSCRHRFADCQPTDDHVAAQYGDDYFSGGALGYPDYLAERRLLRERGRNYARLMKTFTVPGRMLDVGAAAGFVLEGFRDEDWVVTGIEPNASMARHARERVNIEVHCASLEDFAADRPFDLVTMIQVIGHVTDPTAAAHRLAALTRTRGFCLIESWDHHSLSARCFGRGWQQYSPPSVLHYFNDESVRRLMNQAGFSFVRSGRMLKWIDGEHAKSLFAHKVDGMPMSKLVTTASKIVPDRFALPYPLDDLKWWLFEKSESVE